MRHTTDEEGESSDSASSPIISNPFASLNPQPTNPYGDDSILQPNPQLAYIGVANFPLWFQHKLSRKYSFLLDRLLMAMKPSLLLLKESRTTFEQMGALLASDTKKEGFALQEVKGLQPYIDNSIHIIDAIVIDFPVFVDREYLNLYQKQVNEVIRLVTINLHPFTHMEPDQTALKRQVQRKAQRITAILDLLHKYLNNIQEVLERQKPVLDRLDLLKKTVIEPMKDVLVEFDRLSEIERQQKTDMANATSKYKSARQKYQQYMKDSRLAKGVQLQQECAADAERLAEMLGPFAKICQNLNSKKWVMGEETEGLSTEDVIRIKKYTAIALKSNFLEELFISSPSDMLQCLDAIQITAEKGPSILGLSKKNQAAVLEYCKMFDREALLHTYVQFQLKSKKIHKFEQDPDYCRKYKEFQDVLVQYEQAKKQFNRTQREFNKAMEAFKNFMDDWNRLRYNVAKCCIIEFRLLVELTFPPRPIV